MEVIDYDALSIQDHENIIAAAPPCEECTSKENLVLGVITTHGDEFGELLILCSNCHLEIKEI